MKKAVSHILIPSILLSVSIFCFIQKQDSSPALAEQTRTQTTLGYRTETTSGFEGVKTFINGSDVAFYQSTGRIVYSEIPGGPPIIESLGANINGFNDPPVVRVYYYYPTTTLPKITSITQIYNDWTSVVYMTNQLEQRIHKIQPTYSLSEVNQATLKFLRSLRSSYDSFKWSLCAGSLDTTFLQSIANENNASGLNILDFFYDLLEDKNSFNSTLYGSYLSNTINNISFCDYINTTKNYDLIHMFASANCFLYDSIAAQTGYHNIETFLDALTSWGGDIQQATHYYSENNLFPNSFDHILNNAYAMFDWGDFYADVDSKNLIKYALPSTSHGLISEAIAVLLQLSTYNRFHYFACSAGFLNLTNFEYYVESMLYLDPSFSYLYDSFAESIDNYNLPDIYENLKGEENIFPTESLRQCFSGLFVTRITQLGT